MKTYQKISLVLLALAMILSACGGGGAQSDADPVAILQAVEAAFDARDPDAIAALYAEGGYDVNGRGTFTGRDEIRELYAEMVQKATIDCRNYVANGNTVTYECIMNRANLLTGEQYEAVVENGKIKSNVRTGVFSP